MRLSDKFPVPREIALLYDFVNSIDLRRYVEQGAAHVARDELSTPAQLKLWLHARGLSNNGGRLSAEEFRRALELRDALRTFLQLEPADRADETAAGTRLNAVAAKFPLTLTVCKSGSIALQSSSSRPSSGLGNVLAQLQRLSETTRLDRLKMCASEECRWIYFDRSKPGNRRWCSSAICGNRHKTRAHRQRRREAAKT